MTLTSCKWCDYQLIDPSVRGGIYFREMMRERARHRQKVKELKEQRAAIAANKVSRLLLRNPRQFQPIRWDLLHNHQRYVGKVKSLTEKSSIDYFVDWLIDL